MIRAGQPRRHSRPQRSSLWVRLGLLLLAAACLALPAQVSAQPGPPQLSAPIPKAGENPKELEGIGIIDKNGAALPRDVKLTGSDGRDLVLGEYMDGDRPLVLVLAYYQCPMLCSMVLNGALTSIKSLDEQPGKDFRVLVVSFDPRDKVEVAAEKRKNYLEAMGRRIEPINGSELAAFEFAIGSEEEVRRLADAVGFQYRWDDQQNQYAHAAGIFVVTPRGNLSQTLTGVEFAPVDVSRALSEAQRGVWHSPLKSVLLFCFQYNPHTGKYVLMAGRSMRIGAALSVLTLSYLIFRLFRADRRKKAALQGTGQS